MFPVDSSDEETTTTTGWTFSVRFVLFFVFRAGEDEEACGS